MALIRVLFCTTVLLFVTILVLETYDWAGATVSESTPISQNRNLAEKTSKTSLSLRSGFTGIPQSVEARRRPSQMVNITLYEQGIYPQEIRVRPGRVIFSIDDKYGASSGHYIHASGRVERFDKPTERTTRWKGVIELGLGQHEIGDSSKPESRAILIVEP